MRPVDQPTWGVCADLDPGHPGPVSSHPADPAREPTTLTLADAAVLLSSGHGAVGQRLLRTVASQLERRGVPTADRDDVRADVAYALLTSPRPEALTLDLACAHVALLSRNKAVDLHRRRRREAPDVAIAEHAGATSDEMLQRDLDAVVGEAHRRAVSRELVELVRRLPSPERLALTATATGAGHIGSGLGRSSHYRALDRARLRLTAVVRSRVAAGLALPAALLRAAEHLRGLVVPLGATAAAALASAAFVLPAIETPAYDAHAAVTPRIARSATSVAKLVRVAPARVAHRRAPLPRPIVLRVVPRRSVRHPAARVAPAAPVARTTARRATPIAPAPTAGLGPCRAAQLCQ
jgi:hypothetical protein